jgi:hypothetical protein
MRQEINEFLAAFNSLSFSVCPSVCQIIVIMVTFDGYCLVCCCGAHHAEAGEHGDS